MKGVSKTLGVDYAWDHVPIEALIRYGADFVCRYVSSDLGKDESLGEAKELAKHGIWSVLVYETTAHRAGEGFDAGVIDGHRALARLATLQAPAGRPVYFAVDYDTPGAAVAPYFRGVRSVVGRAAGVYGSYRVCKFLHEQGLVNWMWQTYAWSGGAWYAPAQLQQYKNDIKVGGVDCDADRATTFDYGQWMPGKGPAPAPAPIPQPVEEDDMPAGMQINNGRMAVTSISLPKGKFKAIGFMGDNGLQNLPPAKIRVAVHSFAHGWHVEHLVVDSTKAKAWIGFPHDDTDGVSVQREDDGAANLSWDAQ